MKTFEFLTESTKTGKIYAFDLVKSHYEKAVANNDYIAGVVNSFVHFTNYNKVSINPKNQFKTPHGIYFYPSYHVLNRSDEYLKSLNPEFRDISKYVAIFSLKNTSNGEILNIQETKKNINQYITLVENYITSVAKKFNLDETDYRKKFHKTVEDSISVSQYAYEGRRNDGYQILYFGGIILSEMYNLGEDRHSNPSLFTYALARKNGIAGLIDVNLEEDEYASKLKGAGSIHTNEPTQGVIFDPAAIREKIIVPNNRQNSDIKNVQKSSEELTGEELYQELIIDDNIKYVQNRSNTVKKIAIYISNINDANKRKKYENQFEKAVLPYLNKFEELKDNEYARLPQLYANLEKVRNICNSDNKINKLINFVKSRNNLYLHYLKFINQDDAAEVIEIIKKQKLPNVKNLTSILYHSGVLINELKSVEKDTDSLCEFISKYPFMFKFVSDKNEDFVIKLLKEYKISRKDYNAYIGKQIKHRTAKLAIVELLKDKNTVYLYEKDQKTMQLLFAWVVKNNISLTSSYIPSKYLTVMCDEIIRQKGYNAFIDSYITEDPYSYLEKSNHKFDIERLRKNYNRTAKYPVDFSGFLSFYTSNADILMKYHGEPFKFLKTIKSKKGLDNTIIRILIHLTTTNHKYSENDINNLDFESTTDPYISDKNNTYYQLIKFLLQTKKYQGYLNNINIFKEAEKDPYAIKEAFLKSLTSIQLPIKIQHEIINVIKPEYAKKIMKYLENADPSILDKLRIGPRNEFIKYLELYNKMATKPISLSEFLRIYNAESDIDRCNRIVKYNCDVYKLFGKIKSASDTETEVLMDLDELTSHAYLFPDNNFPFIDFENQLDKLITTNLSAYKAFKFICNPVEYADYLNDHNVLQYMSDKIWFMTIQLAFKKLKFVPDQVQLEMAELFKGRESKLRLILTYVRNVNVGLMRQLDELDPVN